MAPLRADARRNRDQIIAAARDLFVEQGLSVPMEEIARRAGVGVGTLYRRFPDRGALTIAVVIDAIMGLVEIAQAAWDSEPDAWQALRRTILGFTDSHIGILHLAVQDKIPEMIADEPELRAARQAWLDLVTRMVTGAQEIGVLRRDVGVADVAIMTSLLTRSLHMLHVAGEHALSARFLTIALDGLRAAPDVSSLPGSPMTLDELLLLKPTAHR